MCIHRIHADIPGVTDLYQREFDSPILRARRVAPLSQKPVRRIHVISNLEKHAIASILYLSFPYLLNINADSDNLIQCEIP
jgi:hypothetical protein